jgi:hypothetical protein
MLEPLLVAAVGIAQAGAAAQALAGSCLHAADTASSLGHPGHDQLLQDGRHLD